MERWANLFDELVVCSPQLAGPPPVGFSPYPRSVRLHEVRAGGGNTRRAKAGLLLRIPGWARSTRRLAREVDSVVIRCPSNVGAIALFSTWRAVQFRAALYAAVWRDYPGQPPLYRAQRLVLSSGRFDGPVFVYASEPLRPRLVSFFSTSYDRAAWDAAQTVADERARRMAARPAVGPWQLVAVGRLTPNKNHAVAVDALALLVDAGLDVRLDIVGSGPQLSSLQTRVEEAGLNDRVRFLGEIDHRSVASIFERADLQILPTRQEGFGKVLLEGMISGVVPVLADGPAAVDVSGGGTRAVVVDGCRPEDFAGAVAALVRDRDRWHALAVEARAYAGRRTVEAFEARIREVLEHQWGVALRNVGEGRV